MKEVLDEEETETLGDKEEPVEETEKAPSGGGVILDAEKGKKQGLKVTGKRGKYVARVL